MALYEVLEVEVHTHTRSHSIFNDGGPESPMRSHTIMHTSSGETQNMWIRAAHAYVPASVVPTNWNEEQRPARKSNV